MSDLRKMLASCVDPEKCEATAYPYWLIIDPKGVGLSAMRQRVHHIAHAVTGPFFSREEANQHLLAASHHFSIHAVVYCASGHASRDWRMLLEKGNEVSA